MNTIHKLNSLHFSSLFLTPLSSHSVPHTTRARKNKHEWNSHSHQNHMLVFLQGWKCDTNGLDLFIFFFFHFEWARLPSVFRRISYRSDLRLCPFRNCINLYIEIIQNPDNNFSFSHKNWMLCLKPFYGCCFRIFFLANCVENTQNRSDFFFGEFNWFSDFKYFVELRLIEQRCSYLITFFFFFVNVNSCKHLCDGWEDVRIWKSFVNFFLSSVCQHFVVSM